jgi:hypothetical protein
MSESHEIARLKQEIDRLSAENNALRQEGLRGSKTEAMQAFEYDRIPNFLKTQKAIRIQRRISTAALFCLPVLIIVGFIIGGIEFYHQQQESLAIGERLKRMDAEFQK